MSGETNNQEPTTKDRLWDVLLIGGAAGTGKTSVSYRVARHFGIGITEVDDFQVLIEAMTTPEQQPALHYWNTHPEAALWPAERIVELTIASGEAMAVGLRAVIANHLESNARVVLEGDYMLPSVATTFAERVRAVYLYEPDEEQILANFLRREPDAGEQTLRARVSWLYGDWLRREAERSGLPALPARPWETLFERVLAVIA